MDGRSEERAQSQYGTRRTSAALSYLDLAPLSDPPQAGGSYQVFFAMTIAVDEPEIRRYASRRA